MGVEAAHCVLDGCTTSACYYKSFTEVLNRLNYVGRQMQHLLFIEYEESFGVRTKT
jgi:hypothetical protein